MNNFSLSKGSFAIQYTKYCFTTFPPTRVDLSRNTARVPKLIHRRTNNNKGQQRRFFYGPGRMIQRRPAFVERSTIPPPFLLPPLPSHSSCVTFITGQKRAVRFLLESRTTRNLRPRARFVAGLQARLACDISMTRAWV